MDLLIHSMNELASIIFPVLNAVKPRSIVEIGAEHGGMTTRLYDWSTEHGATLTSIDPNPSEAFRTWSAGVQGFTHIEAPSLDAIPALDDTDCWFIDGDHNWYTVFHELQLIHAHAQARNKPLLVFLHDTCWPAGRRDQYYAPQRIPGEYCHPHSFDLGVTLQQEHLIEGGFRGEGAFAWARHRGGPRNGVMTAIEDFAQPHGEAFALATVPAVFGLSVLFSTDADWTPELVSLLMPYHDNPLLARMEQDRLLNYLRVIELQDAAAAAMACA